MASFPRRLLGEFQDLEKADLPYFTDLTMGQSKTFSWEALVVPMSAPYLMGAFRVEFTFPPDYPFRPPRLKFHTRIYHPNVGEDGSVCLPLIFPENWRPTVKMEMVVEALVALINSPQPENALRPEISEEFVKNRRKFLRVAEEFTLKHAEPRP